MNNYIFIYLNKMNQINFYSHTYGKYSAFSNFSNHPVIIDNKYYPTNLSNFNDNFELFLNYIIDNQNIMNIEKINYNLQPKKWYLTNYH